MASLFLTRSLSHPQCGGVHSPHRGLPEASTCICPFPREASVAAGSALRPPSPTSEPSQRCTPPKDLTGLGPPGHPPTPQPPHPKLAQEKIHPLPPSSISVQFRSVPQQGGVPRHTPRQPPTASTHQAALPVHPAALRLGLAAGGVAVLPWGPVARPGR